MAQTLGTYNEPYARLLPYTTSPSSPLDEPSATSFANVGMAAMMRRSQSASSARIGEVMVGSQQWDHGRGRHRGGAYD